MARGLPRTANRHKVTNSTNFFFEAVCACARLVMALVSIY